MIKVWYLIVVTAWPPAALPVRQDVPITMGKDACLTSITNRTKVFSKVKDPAFYWRLDCESRLIPKPKAEK